LLGAGWFNPYTCAVEPCSGHVVVEHWHACQHFRKRRPPPVTDDMLCALGPLPCHHFSGLARLICVWPLCAGPPVLVTQVPFFPCPLPVLRAEVSVDEDAFAKCEGLMDRLLELDDVDSVYTNCEGLSL
jgi:hypothetical protein